jgi:hypothetical protein
MLSPQKPFKLSFLCELQSGSFTGESETLSGMGLKGILALGMWFLDANKISYLCPFQGTASLHLLSTFSVWLDEIRPG